MECGRKMLIKNFLKDTFIERSSNQNIPSVYAVIPEEPDEKNENNPIPLSSLERQTANNIILNINRVLGIVCISSLLAIIFYPLITQAQLPEIISNVFSITVGYFGSTLLTYMEKYTKL
jgi:hypothetical protein